VITSIRRKFFAIFAIPLACFALSTGARAEAIDIAAEPVPEFTVLAWPVSHMVNEFTSSVSGVVTLSVSRVDWGDLFSYLSTAIALPNQPLLTGSGDAQFMFNITAGERFITSIFAAAAGPRGYSAYSLGIAFAPRLSQVPLPAAAWLLLSGLAGLGVVARRRRATGAVEPARA
jgi:hypothetical protein